MEDAQHFDASFYWPIENHVVANKEVPNIVAQVETSLAHLRLCRIESESLLNGVEEANRDGSILAFSGNILSDLL
ncbi:MAG: hypothetical protein ABIP48_28030 [Planctomycetota bacterium]